MAFMQKQVTDKQKWYGVETTQGTEFIPWDLIGDLSNATEEDLDAGLYSLAVKEIMQYCEGTPLSWEVKEGFGARLSAPGYMDRTEWTVFDTVAEAEQYLEDMYGDEDSEEMEG